MVPRGVDSTNQNLLPANAHAHRDVFQARLTWQDMHFYHHGDTICHPKSGYTCINNQTTRNVRVHVDATIMRSFQAEQFSRFLPADLLRQSYFSKFPAVYRPTYVCRPYVGYLAAAKHCHGS